MMGTVEFYENVNRLQEVIEASEDRRLDLNRQFISALKTDVISRDKRNIRQLQAYWKQICDNEARSKDRNAKLLDDIDKIERNMGALARKTERLRGMKKQYEEYVERMYPNWREQILTQLHQEEPVAERLQSPVRDSPPVRAVRTPPAVIDTRVRSMDSPMHALRPTSIPDLGSPTAAPVPPLELSALRSTSSNERRTGSDFGSMLTTSTAAHGDTKEPPATGKSDITAVTPIVPKVSIEGKKEQRVSFDMSTLKKALSSDDEDEDVEFEIPILSSRESTPKPREIMRVEVQNHQPPARSNGHDLSDSFSASLEEPKLTMSGLFHLLQFVEDEVRARRSSPAHRKPMLYRSSTPKDCVADEVIKLGNAGRDPGHLNPVSISMVIGDQLPAIVGSLPGHCLLSDVIVMDFVNSEEKVDEEFITSGLSDSKLELWNRLLAHFKALVHYQVMKPQEVAEVFAASLIVYDSRLEVKTIELLVTILEDSAFADSLTEDSTSMVTPRAALPTVTFKPREANPLGDSLMATAGSFNDTTPLKVTRNPELRSTESDQQLIFLRNALRAKDESDDEEEDFDTDLGTGHWKKEAQKEEEEEEEEESNELDLIDGAAHQSYISASIQSPEAAASLKDSDAYQRMLGKGPQRKSSTHSSDDDDLDMLLSGPPVRSSLPAVREIDLSDSGERIPDGISGQTSAQVKPISTQELLKSVTKDQDDLDIETSEKPWNSSKHAKDKAVVIDDDENDEFDEFFK